MTVEFASRQRCILGVTPIIDSHTYRSKVPELRVVNCDAMQSHEIVNGGRSCRLRMCFRIAVPCPVCLCPRLSVVINARQDVEFTFYSFSVDWEVADGKH